MLVAQEAEVRPYRDPGLPLDHTRTSTPSWAFNNVRAFYQMMREGVLPSEELRSEGPRVYSVKTDTPQKAQRRAEIQAYWDTRRRK